MGDSFASHLARRVNTPGIVVLGRRGATLQDEAFRRWVLQEAARHQPDAVLLIVGGNDLAAPTCRLRSFIGLTEEIAAGLLATGTPEVIFLRVSRRPQDVSAKQHRRRRKLLNLALHQRFAAAPVRCQSVRFPNNFLGADGTHPSAVGWRWLASVIRHYGDQ